MDTISTGDALVQGYEKLGKGDMSGFVGVLMSSTYGPANGNDFGRYATLSNELLGQPKEDLKTVTREVVESGKSVSH